MFNSVTILGKFSGGSRTLRDLKLILFYYNIGKTMTDTAVLIVF